MFPLRRSRSNVSDATLRIYDMIECFDACDYLGALAVSDDVFDHRATVTPGAARRANALMSARAAFVLSLVEDGGSLEDLVYATGLPMLDALKCVCELVERGLLRVSTIPEPASSEIRVTG